MKQSRLKRWFPVWLRWVLGILLVPILAVLWGDWRAEREWRQYCAEARARGVKLTLAEFLPKEPIPDEDNFAAIPIFVEAIKSQGSGPRVSAIRNINVIPKFRPQKHRWIGPKKVDFAGIRLSFIASKCLEAGDLDLGGDDATAVLRGLEKVEPELIQIHQASGRKRSSYPVSWDNPWITRFDHLQVIMSFSRILHTKVCAELAIGNSDQAFSDLNDLFALCESLQDEPTLIAYLIQRSCYSHVLKSIWEGLDSGKWTDAQLNEMEMRLGAINTIKRYQFALQSEQGSINTGMEQFAKTRFSQSTRSAIFSVKPESFLERVVRLQSFTLSYWRDNQLASNRRLDQELPQWDSIDERWEKKSEIEDKEKLMSKFQELRLNLYQMITPVFGSTGNRTLMGHVQIRLAGLACALERFKNSRGTYPERLEDLMPDFLQKLPHEPFNGKPFRYRRTEDGSYRLYSIGMDLKDDGGTFNNKESHDFVGQPDWLWWAPGQVERVNAEAEKNAK